MNISHRHCLKWPLWPQVPLLTIFSKSANHKFSHVRNKIMGLMCVKLPSIKRLKATSSPFVFYVLSRKWVKTPRNYSIACVSYKIYWLRLPMGHLIRPNCAAWYDFCNIKNLKFPVFPIIRMRTVELRGDGEGLIQMTISLHQLYLVKAVRD